MSLPHGRDEAYADAMTAAQDASQQTQRWHTKRDAILDAAAGLFNQRGIKGVTVGDVARAVNLGPTAVTYYFPRKEDIAAACLLRTLTLLAHLQTQAQAEATPALRIRRYLDLYFEILAQIALGERAEPVSFTDIRALDGPQVGSVQNAFHDLFRGFRTMLRPAGGATFDRALESGRAHLFFGQTIWARTWLARYDPKDYGRAAARMADTLINGLATGDIAWRTRSQVGGGAGPSTGLNPAQESYVRAISRLLNDHGYHGASIDRIVSELKVTKGSFYHHHATKDDAVAGCAAWSDATVRAAQRQATGDTAAGRLASATDFLVRFQVGDQGPLMHYAALAGAPGTLRSEVAMALERLTLHTAGVISDGMIEGSLRLTDATIAAQLVIGGIQAASDLSRWNGEHKNDATATDFVRAILHGLLDATG